MFKKLSAIIMSLCFIAFSAGCGDSLGEKTAETKASAEETTVAVKTNLPKLDMSKWEYSSEGDVYCQTGILYCETPVDEKYEKLAIFVPGAYMDAKDNGNGTFTCKTKEGAEVDGCTALNAPILMPVFTPYYAAAEAMTEYQFLLSMVTEYTSQGFVVVYSGCRGLNEGAPTGVTDLKAAIRYVRYCDDIVPGSAENIFVYGMSGGGAQAAVLGASGNSKLYDPYLEKIGAIQGVSDAVAGTMAWCPVTSLDTADAEYEWMMGCTRPERNKEEQAISDNLAKAYADYVNKAGFTDKDGNALALTESKEGIYQAGTYYDHLKNVIEQSLNNYLSDTKFSEKYTVEDYIDSLNKDRKWITYDKQTNTATITSVSDFAKTCKPASETLVAFDLPHSSNTLFGYGDGKGAHYDSILENILTELNSEYASEYTEDLKKTDALGYTVEQRMNMYAPLYYLMKSREGYGTSTVAKYWRIRTGIEQISTSVTTEVNLALALEHCEGVKSVDFETVWAQDHTEAERTGTSAENFTKWVKECVK